MRKFSITALRRQATPLAFFLSFALCLLTPLVGSKAAADQPGAFDYYVLALSWSPNWCAREGDARNADQCHPRHDHGWTLHGLWPQYERGYPSDCPAPRRLDPSRGESDAMADIMGSGGLAWHEWKTHGRCSGLSGPDYYALSRAAYGAVTRPPVLRQLDRPIRVPASVIEEAWLQANPEMTADQITITCRGDQIAEARICLTKDLVLRACAPDVARDCRAENALLAPVR